MPPRGRKNPNSSAKKPPLRTPSSVKRKRQPGASGSALRPGVSPVKYQDTENLTHDGHPNSSENDLSKDDADGPSPMVDDETRQDYEEDVLGAGRNYFEAHKGAIATTNLSLANLTVSSPDELTEALAQFEDPLLSRQNDQAKMFKKQHGKYEYFLKAGHSLLFYGFGSKKYVLDNFATHLSSTGDVVVINGFNPTFNLRTALTQFAGEVLGLKSFTRRSLLDYVDAIRDAMAANKKLTASIVIHNMDGPSLRPSDAQLALSRLAAIPRLWFVGSIDHVNAPLLWDAPMYTSFSWMWVAYETFGTYEAETFFSSKPLARGGTERRVEGAIAFLNSLAEKARSVFRELAVRQMGGEEGGAATRTTFNDLFESAKEQFLVSDTGTLRNILNEIETHDLLQTRRGADAAQQLWIPLQDKQLEAILNEIGLPT